MKAIRAHSGDPLQRNWVEWRGGMDGWMLLCCRMGMIMDTV